MPGCRVSARSSRRGASGSRRGRTRRLRPRRCAAASCGGRGREPRAESPRSGDGRCSLPAQRGRGTRRRTHQGRRRTRRGAGGRAEPATSTILRGHRRRTLRVAPPPGRGTARRIGNKRQSIVAPPARQRGAWRRASGGASSARFVAPRIRRAPRRAAQRRLGWPRARAARGARTVCAHPAGAPRERAGRELLRARTGMPPRARSLPKRWRTSGSTSARPGPTRDRPRP